MGSFCFIGPGSRFLLCWLLYFLLRKLQPEHPGRREYTTKEDTELFRMEIGAGLPAYLRREVNDLIPAGNM